MAESCSIKPQETQETATIGEPHIINMGCRLNAYESSVIKSIMKSLNLTDEFALINTCTVTNESERQCRQEIRKIKKHHPQRHLLVTGCASQLHTEFFMNMPEVSFVISNDMKLKKSAYNQIKSFYEGKTTKEEVQTFLLQKDDNSSNNCKQNDEESEWEYLHNFEDKSRAFIAIHNGCNHYCSFCIIPFTRGKFKSVDPEFIVNQIKIFIQNGYNEVVLTGVDITDYGHDDGKKERIWTLGKLCKKILTETTLPRLRLSSVDVAEIDDDIKDLIINEKRFMPYFHISLQSGDNEILRKMRRRHKREDVISFCKFVLQHRPEAAFGADIITGFPSETFEQFENSFKIVQECPISFVHAFPYSKKEKTLAFSMNDNVPKDEKKRRVHLLINEGKNNLNLLYNSLINNTYKAIIESEKTARLENFTQVIIDNNHNYDIGQIVEIKPYEINKEEKLIGQVL
ncbi:MAG: tRNA ((6)-L-threonylcarbamoyladenosine(37)-C(2))-methylthiotransferase MtaB [Pseudomonadota bacterium]|jgi:threonylcarbamoyladenosine tRNA methylthiotransferase MtaB